jgi:ABC-2 type transport system ATP-binding protein
MAKAAIRINNLTHDYRQVRALDGLTLEVPAGEVFGFLGPNGAGKTTTLNVLLGLLTPTSGDAEVLGYNTRTQGELIRTHSGALLEHSGIYEEMSAYDNLDFYGRAYRMSAPERQRRIQELLTRSGLWERRLERARTWSKGMKQRLAILRAMLHRPQLLFLDEPTAGLDVISASELRKDLVEMAHSEGITVFLTTHNMQEAENICREVAVIRAGKVLAVGTPDELRASAGGPRLEVFGKGFTPQALERLRTLQNVTAASFRNEHVEITLGAQVNINDLTALLVEEGVELYEVRRGKASLEDVFLALVQEEENVG